MASLTPSTMNAETWVRLSRLLDVALDLSPSERVPWLAALGPEDEALKPRLLALLAHAPSVQAADFLGTIPNVDIGAIDVPDQSADHAGATVGPYTLLRELGEGGMGTVWLAHRTDGIVQRAVALKLPRGAWPRAELLERMARERDILAALTHPHIARLYDAGVTPGGRPYLALEYVEGRAIDEYCNDHRLDVRARVRAFLQVAEAVAYAHGKLVVHRDVKPSNILVTADGQVRLLDFGIAKLLDEGHAQLTMLSEMAGRPLTPEYASPEQIAGEPLGIASDVYSLGVVLYELLTGTRPHRPERASRRALEYVEALPWMDRAIAASAGADAATNAGRLGMLAQRAQVLFRLGRRKEALSEATAAVESLQRLPAVGRTGPLSLARVLLGRMLIETGRPREAEASLTAALDELAPLGDAHPQRAEASCELGRARLLQGGGAGDWQRLEQCLPIYRTWGLAEREVVASLEGLLAARSSGAR